MFLSKNSPLAFCRKIPEDFLNVNFSEVNLNSCVWLNSHCFLSLYPTYANLWLFSSIIPTPSHPLINTQRVNTLFKIKALGVRRVTVYPSRLAAAEGFICERKFVTIIFGRANDRISNYLRLLNCYIKKSA